MHGFLLLRSEDGKLIATGDQIVVAHGNQVRSRLIFHFRDGSIDDEVTTFRQSKTLDLISDHHLQKGPSFPHPLNVQIDVPKGQVTYIEFKDGASEQKTEHMDMPDDLANGLVSSVVENLSTSAAESKVSYLTASPKPRIVRLAIKPDGEGHFRVGGGPRLARRFRIHIELGGVAGVIAPMVGKQPTDLTMWVMSGEVPAFLNLEGALYEQGPTWKMELTSPVW